MAGGDDGSGGACGRESGGEGGTSHGSDGHSKLAPAPHAVVEGRHCAYCLPTRLKQPDNGLVQQRVSKQSPQSKEHGMLGGQM